MMALIKLTLQLDAICPIQRPYNSKLLNNLSFHGAPQSQLDGRSQGQDNFARF